MPRGHDPVLRTIGAECWAPQSPSPAGTTQEPARTHATSQGGTYVFAQIPTSVLLIKPIVSNITGRTFVPPGGPIEASRCQAQLTSAKLAADHQRAVLGLIQTLSCFLRVHDALTDHVPRGSRHSHQRHKVTATSSGRSQDGICCPPKMRLKLQ